MQDDGRHAANITEKFIEFLTKENETLLSEIKERKERIKRNMRYIQESQIQCEFKGLSSEEIAFERNATRGDILGILQESEEEDGLTGKEINAILAERGIRGASTYTFLKDLFLEGKLRQGFGHGKYVKKYKRNKSREA